MPGVHVECIDYPPEHYRVFFFAHRIASELRYRRPTLLFITEWGIWPSSENWHLYYNLRQTYGDNRLLHEAPGRLFLEHEGEDFASFLQLSMLNGWGGYVLTEANYVNAFFATTNTLTSLRKTPEPSRHSQNARNNPVSC
jgi:hypothetical protein